LSPVVAAAVLGASTELTGTVASLEDVWARDAGQVEERLRAATSWDERFTIAADVLARRLGARPSVDPEVAYTWRRTVTSRGRVRVDGLADEVGWSRKRLWSRFRSQIGLTPKRAAQLVRFDHAAHLLAAGHPAASVAAQRRLRRPVPPPPRGQGDRRSHAHHRGHRAVARDRRRSVACCTANLTPLTPPSANAASQAAEHRSILLCAEGGHSDDQDRRPERVLFAVGVKRLSGVSLNWPGSTQPGAEALDSAESRRDLR
jgi:AraC-like DNA-binding protein